MEDVNSDDEDHMETEGKTKLVEDAPQNVQPAKEQDINTMMVEIEALKHLLMTHATARAGQANVASTASVKPGTAAAPPTVAKGEDTIPMDQDDENNGGDHKPG